MNDNQNSNITTIHDFDHNLICEYFLGMERQGPGSPGLTLSALGFTKGISAGSHIADLGCGTGGQTMTLAAATNARITAVDVFPAFVDRLNEQAREVGDDDRVTGLVGSMEAPPFAPASLDAIWCEGAIYNIGFERGLSLWRDLLKPGGYVVVSENTWFTDRERRPSECAEFWQAAYPEIDTVEAKISAIGRAGYRFEAAFRMPDECWYAYYASHDEARRTFLSKHAGNAAAEAFVAGELREREMHERTGRHWGLTFFVCRKE